LGIINKRRYTGQREEVKLSDIEISDVAAMSFVTLQIVKNSPHHFFSSPAAPSRLRSARVPVPILLHSPLWCGVLAGAKVFKPTLHQFYHYY